VELAKLYLQQILDWTATHNKTDMRSNPSGKVKDLHLLDVVEFREGSTHLVRFEQLHQSLPVYGARTFCELDESKGLIAAQGELATIEVPPEPKLLPSEALRRIASDKSLEKIVGKPSLTYYRQPEEEKWHLAYRFSRVPVAPPSILHSLEAGTVGGDPRLHHPSVEYFVDANDGSVIHAFSSDAFLADPTDLDGLDEDGNRVEFQAHYDAGGYELLDPWLSISTRDLAGGDVYDFTFGAVPDPIRSPTGAFSTAAVTAQANASKIFRFLNSILVWHGVDGQGRELVNIVNCTCRYSEAPPPEWPQAIWWRDMMWYGQSKANGSRMASFARHIDVMAHEVMHGVTQFTVGLETAGESGALNESLSDIFGVIIKNWDWSRFDGGDTWAWDWAIGQDALAAGKPLRNIGNPAISDSPAHMNHYDTSGEVHKNSAIHSKAGFNLLTKRDDVGSPLFTPLDVAILYYRCLLKLTPRDRFRDALSKLLDSALTKYRFRPEERDEKLAAIKSCYADVGITLN